MEIPNPSNVIRLIAFIILGATGVYLLLPHQHGRTKPRLAHLMGYGLTALGIAFFVSFWKPTGPFLSMAFFYAFGLAAVIGAVFTITSINPIHSALWFASVVLATSGLFLLAGAQFLAAGTIIVYAGAIIVTFLFVIMLAQMEGRATYDRMARSPFYATFTSFLLMFGLVYAVAGMRVPSSNPKLAQENQLSVPFRRAIDQSTNLRLLSKEQALVYKKALPATSTLPEVTKQVDANGKPVPAASGRHVAGLGGTLYTEHLVTVELAGALLFAALIGALAIATPKTPVRPTSTDASAQV